MSLLQSRQWGSAVWGSTAFVPYGLWVKVTDYPLWVNNTAAITAHIHSWRYRMALQPLSQIVTWANRLLDRFLCFPMLTDCCGQSVGAALNLKERNQGMIYSLLLAVKKPTMEHQGKWSGKGQKKWFFLTQHWVKLELAAMGCCGGQNKERVKNTRAHLWKNEGCQTQRCKQSLWLMKPSCLLPKSMRLYSEKHHWITVLLLYSFLKCPHQLLSETAYWARWAFSLAEKRNFFFSMGTSTVFVGWNVLYLAAEKQEKEVSSSMKLRSQDSSSLCAEPREHLESAWQTQCGKGNKQKWCNMVCFLFPVLYHLLSVP